MIYLITNKQTGDTYVGKTIRTLPQRLEGHFRDVKYGSNTHLHRAMRKYGNHNFQIELLQEHHDDINDAEIQWIAKLDPTYNMTKGGDGGWIHDQTGNTWKVKDSSKMGITFKNGGNHTSKWEKAVTGGNNYQCNYIITTPWGEFETWRDATNTAKELRKTGRNDVVTDGATLKKYCKENIKLNEEGRRTYPTWRGKYTHDIGFKYELKGQDDA